MRTPTCPYCGEPSRKVAGAAMYPHRPDLHGKTFYQCAPCDAHVGCRPGTEVPLGRLANAELRRHRGYAHAAFDPLWRGEDAPMSRTDAYAWLANALGISPIECHIALFDVEQCRNVRLACSRVGVTLAGEQDGVTA